MLLDLPDPLARQDLPVPVRPEFPDHASSAGPDESGRDKSVAPAPVPADASGIRAAESGAPVVPDLLAERAVVAAAAARLNQDAAELPDASPVVQRADAQVPQSAALLLKRMGRREKSDAAADVYEAAAAESAALQDHAAV
jgi:hypothetical protein